MEAEMSRGDFVQGVLNGLCRKMGLGDLPLDADGRLTLAVGDMPVSFSLVEEPVEILWIHADLGEIPGEGEAAPTFLMRLAFECWGLNRMTVGLDETGRRAWGYTCIPAELLTDAVLELTLNALLEVAMPVREQLSHGDFPLPEPGPPDSGTRRPDAGMVLV